MSQTARQVRKILALKIFERNGQNVPGHHVVAEKNRNSQRVADESEETERRENSRVEKSFERRSRENQLILGQTDGRRVHLVIHYSTSIR